MKVDEQIIIRLLKNGSSDAYKYLYEHYYAFLCTIAFEYLGDSSMSEVLVDDLIMHLWEKRETLDISTSLRNYLIRAIRNRSINYLQLEQQRREVTFSSMSKDDSEFVESSEIGDYPLAVLLENELEEKIMQAIECLPDDCRRVFKMSRFENKSYEQIAEESNISVNTVKYHIKKALLLLKDALKDYL